MNQHSLHGPSCRLVSLSSWRDRLRREEQERTAVAMSRRFKNGSRRRAMARMFHRLGSVIASIAIRTGSIVSLTVSFLTSTETSLWWSKSNWGIATEPGDKSETSTSPSHDTHSAPIGNMPLVKSPPTTIQPSRFQSAYTTLRAFLRSSRGSSGSSFFGSGS